MPGLEKSPLLHTLLGCSVQPQAHPWVCQSTEEQDSFGTRPLSHQEFTHHQSDLTIRNRLQLLPGMGSLDQVIHVLSITSEKSCKV